MTDQATPPLRPDDLRAEVERLRALLAQAQGFIRHFDDCYGFISQSSIRDGQIVQIFPPCSCGAGDVIEAVDTALATEQGERGEGE